MGFQLSDNRGARLESWRPTESY